MTKAEKLFLYTFSEFTEAYGGMEALKSVDRILNEQDRVTWERLFRSVDQQHRVKGELVKTIDREMIVSSVKQQMTKLLKDA